MRKEKNSMLLFHDYRDVFRAMNPNDVAAIVDAMLSYDMGEEIPELSDEANLVFLLFKKSNDRLVEKYNRVCEIRAKAANKRWENLHNGNENGLEETETDAKVCKCMDSDNESENDIDIDIDIDSDSVNESESEKEPLFSYGRYENIFLTHTQYDKLHSLHDNIDDVIDNISLYLKQFDRKYSDYYAAIERWIKNDEYKKASRKGETKYTREANIEEPSYDIDEAIIKAKLIDPSDTKRHA